jgi:hypothetical protein
LTVTVPAIAGFAVCKAPAMVTAASATFTPFLILM